MTKVRYGKVDEKDPEKELDTVAITIEVPRYLREYMHNFAKKRNTSLSSVLRVHMRWLWERENFRATKMSDEDMVRSYHTKGYVIDPLLTKDQRDRLIDELRLLPRKVEDERDGKKWGDIRVVKS